MMSDNIEPEQNLIKHLGDALREVRIHPSRNLTLRQVMQRVHDLLYNKYDFLSHSSHWIAKKLKGFADEFKGELWLASLERGEIKKIDRIIIDLLLLAMDCTFEERNKVLAAGGYHSFPYIYRLLSSHDKSHHSYNGSNEYSIVFEDCLDDAAIILTDTIFYIHPSASILLRSLLEKDSEAMNKLEDRLEFVAAALTLTLKELKELKRN